MFFEYFWEYPFSDYEIFNFEDFAAAIPSETALGKDILGATPFPSSQDTKLKERSSVVRLWRRARKALEKPATRGTGELSFGMNF